MLKRLASFTATAALVPLLGMSMASAETIHYVTAGGVYLENIKAAFLDPIGKKLGIDWVIETSDSDAQVRVQVNSGTVTYDIVEFGAAQCARGAAEGLYEKLDYTVIDTSDFIPGSYSDYYLGSTVFSIVLGWNDKTVGNNHPTTWAEFWDTKKFPGTRSLRKTARATLELALLADGVKPAEVYPLDLDRAFASLEKIKPHIKVWWQSGAESQQLVKDAGIDMIGAFNARLDAVKGDGAPVSYTFNQGIIDFGCWAVVKGSKKKDLAMKILAEFAKPEYQAEMARLSNYGAANTKATEMGIIPPEQAAGLPTAPDNLKGQILTKPEWWAEHGAEAQERMDQFMTQ